jgi:tetratricopeptide (TPR) repeat protein
LSLKEWSKSVRAPFTDPSKPKPGLSGLYRPVVMVTFAVNWYLGKADVFGYHLVNIGIHCATSGLLYFTILNLLNAPNMLDRYRGSGHFIALLATALWALHPIQTQAVTYIVQRMASLAALFYLAGIFLFAKARSVQSPVKRGVFSGLCLLSYLLAIGTKQNAVTLPVALLLIEAIFFINPEIWKRKKAKWIGAATIAGLAIFFGLLFYAWLPDPASAIIDGYRYRPFTMTERLLTESRVLIFYLYQLFYPVPGQFSILHDFSLSTSLWVPWTTPVSFAIILALIVLAFYGLRRKALWSFSILFFFLGHSVESTFFPLELVYEHRNYLPSLFLFLPVASGLKILIEKYRKKSTVIYFLLLGFVSVLVVGLGLGTYTRNMDWATEKGLWQEAMSKAPSSARPYQNVAMALEKENRLDDALRLYEKALDLKDPEPMLSRFISLGNMGNIYKKKKAYDKAVQYLTAALEVETGPFSHRARYNLVLCLLNSHGEEEALEHLEVLLARQNSNHRFLTTKGFILFQQGKTDLALSHLTAALKQNPYDKDALVNIAMALSSKGLFERAEWFLKRAKKRNAGNFVIHMALLQNALTMKDRDRVDRCLSDIAQRFTYADIKAYLDDRARGYHYVKATLVPIDDRIVNPPLVDFLKERARALSNSLDHVD